MVGLLAWCHRRKRRNRRKKVRLTVSCCPFHSTIYWQSLTSGKLVKDKCSRIVKAIVFLVCMYRCESWTTKKAQWQRIGAFELWCWRRLLRVLWTTKWSNQSTLKEINPEYSLEGLVLELQYFGHVMQKSNSLEKTLMLGKIENGRRGKQRRRCLDSITDSMDMNLSKFQETVEDRAAWHATGVPKNQTRLSNQTTASIVQSHSPMKKGSNDTD